MTDASGLYANQNVVFPNYWHGDILQLEGMLDLGEANGFHALVLL